MKAKHNAYAISNINYFKSLKVKVVKRSLQLSIVLISLVMKFIYSLLHLEKNHAIGEGLFQISISAFPKQLREKNDEDIKTMPLCNNNVSTGIDEIGIL